MSTDRDDDIDRPWRAEELLAEIAGSPPGSADSAPSTGDRIRNAFSQRPEPKMDLGTDDRETSPLADFVAKGAIPFTPDDSKVLPEVPPVEVPNHALVRCIDMGGFGQVWLARQTLTDEYRACKLIPAEKAAELDGLRHLKQRVRGHAHLFPIEEIGTTGGWLYCLMPLADNALSEKPRPDVSGYAPLSLTAHLKRHGRMDAIDVSRLGAGLASGLFHLHSNGVTHGDIKPSNVLRLDSRWTVADYGLARDLDRPAGGGHTPAFAPPPKEPLGTPAADQYALGLVLMSALTGLRPDALDKFRSDPVDASGSNAVADAVRRVILQATSPTASDRFASLREVEVSLRQILMPPKPRSWVLPAAAVAILLVLGFVATRLGTTTRPPVTPVAIKSFEVRHLHDNGTEDVPVGRLGFETSAARFNDAVTIRASLTAPGYGYLLSFDTNGKVSLCTPQSADLEPPSSSEVVFPADPTKGYRLNDGVGTQGFMLLVSATKLPSWTQWTAEHGKPTWTESGTPSEGVWVYDGAELKPIGGTRGEVTSLRGGPKPAVDAIQWARSQNDVKSVYLVAFPVMPAKP